MNGAWRIQLAIGVVCAVAPTAQAESLRCGNELVQPGATATEVLALCGEPASKQTISEPIRARNAGGGTRVVGTAEYEIWRYDRGSRRFPAILRFEGGVLKRLEFETS
jgi:hypothetical protein